MNKLCPTILATLLAASCAAELDEEQIGEESADINVQLGGMTTNFMTTNFMTTNFMTTNGLLADGTVTTNPMSTWRDNGDIQLALNDAGTRVFTKKLVGCALNRGDFITLENQAGLVWTEYGEMGLWPDWKNNTCGTACQQWNTACLIAVTNWQGLQVRISLRKHYTDGGNLVTPDPKEATYNWADGAFYGNLFSSSPKRYAATGDEYKTEGFDPPYALNYRFCETGNPGCPVYVTGWMSDDTEVTSPCDGAELNNRLRQSACWDVDDRVPNTCQTRNECATSPGTNYYRVLSAFRPFNEGPCSHSSSNSNHCDYVAGVKLSRYASVSAYTIIVNRGYTHCETSAWDSVCVDRTRQYCAAHDLCTVSGPLHVGDCDAVNEVCADDPWCCTYGRSWDTLCKNRFMAKTGYSCP